MGNVAVARGRKQFVSQMDGIRSEPRIRNQIPRKLGPEPPLKPGGSLFSAAGSFSV